MNQPIKYVNKANRTTIQPKILGRQPSILTSNKSLEPKSSGSIPNGFLRKVNFMEKYPQNLRTYIKDCFAQCTDDKSRDIISSKLMEMINRFTSQGTINQHDWSSQPIVTVEDKPPTPPPSATSEENIPPPPQPFPQYPSRPKQAFDSSFMTAKQSQSNYNYPANPPYPQSNYFPPPPPPPPPQYPPYTNHPPPEYNQGYSQNYYQNPPQYPPSNNFEPPTPPQYNSLQNYNSNPRQPPPPPEIQPPIDNNNSYPKTQQYQSPASYSPGQSIPHTSKPMQSLPNKWSSNPLPPKAQGVFYTPGKELETHQESQNIQPEATFQKKKEKKKKFEQAPVNFVPNTPVRQLSQEKEEIVVPQIVGTSQKLEKQYLRLCGDQEIDPSLLRPLPVLKKSLEYCLDKFRQSGDYEYISEQLRSIRQDLKVQNIEDPFNVLVYETHSRLAIQYGDWSNFQQSVSNLEPLYNKNLGKYENICEFWTYRILFLIAVDDVEGLYSFIPKIDQQMMKDKGIQFALKAWTIASSFEWMRFYEMMKDSTPLIAGVMNLKLQSLRDKILNCIRKSFRTPDLEVYKLFLCFDDEDSLRHFLVDFNIPVPDK